MWRYLLLLVLVTPAQAIDAWDEIKYALVNVEIQSNSNGVILVEKDSKPKVQAVGSIQVVTQAQEVKIEAEDSKRNPLRTVERTSPEESPREWIVYGAGEVWVRIDTKQRVLNEDGLLVDILWDTKRLNLTIGSTPEPDDDDDPPGPEPEPTDISNEYKVGVPAYNAAPNDPQIATALADTYRKAGEFLFGRPSLKFVTSSDSADNSNPDRSVIAWLDQQRNAFTSAKEWDVWAATVKKALVLSQSTRQFTKTDWYNAFNEVANALEVKANGR
jgi:hypothetical protein